MKRYSVLLLLLAAALGLQACVSFSAGPFRSVRGSGDVASETRQVGEFDEIEISDVGEATVVLGDTESLVIEAEENILPLIQSEVRDGRLILGLEPNLSISTTEPIRYTITVRSLQAVYASDSTRVEVEALSGDSLYLDASDSSRIWVDSLEADELEVSASDSSTVEISSGQAADQRLNLSDSSRLDAGSLQGQTVLVTASDSSRAEVWAEAILDATLSSSSEVRYRGEPGVREKSSDSSRLIPEN